MRGMAMRPHGKTGPFRMLVAAVAVAVLLTLAPLLVAACSPAPGGDAAATVAAPTPTAQAASPGREVFAANCAVCHGDDGQGQPEWHVRRSDGTLPAPPLNGDGHTWHHADGLLYRIVKEGGQSFEDPAFPGFKSAMPAFGEQLSHREIVAVLTYVKSLWGDKAKRGTSIREWQAEVSLRDPFPPP